MPYPHDKPKVQDLVAVDPTPVQVINKEVYDYAAKQATGSAYQAVAQSMAQMIQNANTTLLNTEALVQAAQAVFMKKAAEAAANKKFNEAEKFIALTEKASKPLDKMQEFMAKVGTTADDILNKFPVGRGNVASSQGQEIL